MSCGKKGGREAVSRIIASIGGRVPGGLALVPSSSCQRTGDILFSWEVGLGRGVGEGGRFRRGAFLSF